ncbi:hypothetical protein HOA55_05235 [archaeon]|jgi:hypothetical protein|nr:hypothetical protein [archaeon]MBT3577725.1 hypothetical protein [archaeon]MBT6820732.1 hypothetical protein [archaeon]MBT6955896.1 hypothetical protein [archaeon]MBT7025872.1 hypothetical protein [archaeon]
MGKKTLISIVGGAFLGATLTLGIPHFFSKAPQKFQGVEQTREEIETAIIEGLQSLREATNPSDDLPKEVPNPEGYLLTGELAGGLDLDKLTLANKTLVNFPDEIPGAEFVDKYITPGAVKTIVHVRQAHEMGDELREAYLEIGNPEKAERLSSGVKVIQKNIYEILSHLLEGKYIDSVHREGYSEIEHSRPAAYGGSLEPVGEAIDQKCAVDKLWKGRKIRVLPSESYVAYGVAQGVIMVPTDGLSVIEKMRVKCVFDDRENHFLDIVNRTHKGDKPAVTVFGGEHSWGGPYSFKGYKDRGRKLYQDNIAEWNKKNPSKKVSWIEVTPKNYGLVAGE